MSAKQKRQTLPGMGTSNVGVEIPNGHTVVHVAVPALTSCTYNPQITLDGTNWYNITYDIYAQAGQKTTYLGSAVLSYRVIGGCKFRCTTNVGGNDAIQPIVTSGSI